MRVSKLFVVLLLSVFAGTAMAQELKPVEKLGKALFFDKNLSYNKNQSCASCHGPEVGWTGPDEEVNKHGGVYEASIAGRFGNRKPPSAAYATPAPKFGVARKGGGEFVGGNFWDGRATGEKLGSPAADQAQGPFLNPLEQALPDAAELVRRFSASGYASLFKDVWGPKAFDDVEKAYGYIGLSIAAFEASSEVNQFSSKYDAHLAGKARLTEQERRGLGLFVGKGRCNQCHPSEAGSRGEPPLFTDFTYANIGVPRNPDNPFYYNRKINPVGAAWVDLGLAGYLEETRNYKQLVRGNLGKHRVPTLRNVDKRPSEGFVKAYAHNGYFKSLKEVVHFYNTRDTLAPQSSGSQKPGVDCWPMPEVALNINTEEMGNLGLTDEEEGAIVSFLKALSDGYMSPRPAAKAP